MKKLRFISLLLVLGFVFVQCDDEGNIEPITSENGLPESFTIDIPQTISSVSTQKSATDDVFSGEEAYEHLRNFIGIGESAAMVVDDIMDAIREHGLDKEMDFKYEGDDGRQKHLQVMDNVVFEGTSYLHQVNMSDLDSEGNADGGLALQVFWNNNPIEGIVILSPYNWDRINDVNMKGLIYRIDYSEKQGSGYDATMVVTINNWPQDSTADIFAIDNLKMFVGKKNDVVDVYGNSNHPQAWLFMSDTVGLSWSFVASGNEAGTMAVAEVGLPWSSVNSDSRTVLLDEYSVKNVFVRQITQWIKNDEDYEPTPAMLEPYLQEVNAPAFFDATGFVSGGTMPNDNYQPFVENVKALTPFNPTDIVNLDIVFKQ